MEESKEIKWGVYNERDQLVTSTLGILEDMAKRYALNYNEITNTKWYTAKALDPTSYFNEKEIINLREKGTALLPETEH